MVYRLLLARREMTKQDICFYFLYAYSKIDLTVSSYSLVTDFKLFKKIIFSSCISLWNFMHRFFHNV